jgi:hypothetical protein
MTAFDQLQLRLLKNGEITKDFCDRL